MKDYKMEKKSPSGDSNAGSSFGGSGSQGRHDPKVRQSKMGGLQMWWNESKPGGRPDTYVRPKGEVGGGNSTGSGPGPRVA